MVVDEYRKIRSFLENRTYFRGIQEYMELRHLGGYHSLKTYNYWDYWNSEKLCYVFVFKSIDIDKMFEVPEDLNLPVIMRQISKLDEFVEVSFSEILDIFELSGLLNWDRNCIIERLNLCASELL